MKRLRASYDTRIDGVDVRVEVRDVDGDGDPDATLYVAGVRVGSVDVLQLGGKLKRFAQSALRRFRKWKAAKAAKA